MKLAEALLIRADQKKKILSLRERIGQNALAQEGDAPREDVKKLIAECFAVIEEQQALVLKIDAANVAAKLPDGRPLAEVLAARDRDAAAPTFAPDGLYFLGPRYGPEWGLPERTAAYDWLP